MKQNLQDSRLIKQNWNKWTIILADTAFKLLFIYSVLYIMHPTMTCSSLII